MAARLIANFSPGRLAWEGRRDVEGNRLYTVVHRVETTTSLDGPQVVMNAPGLPLIGSIWNFGNDIDLWAFCTPEMTVIPDQTPEGEPSNHWVVQQTFSTVPLERCQDFSIEDPLLEPDRVSGSFVNRTKEAEFDKDGDAILTSSHERVRGAEVEIDDARATVVIEQNVASLGLENFTPMVNTVNDDTLWNLAARKIKLSRVSWSRQVFGVCNFFYTRRFEFDIDFNGFDRAITDVGTKVLNGHWEATGWTLDNINAVAPDKDRPDHFIRIPDRRGEIFDSMLLDGNGEPNTTGTPVVIPLATASGGSVQFYGESDFLTLGIPTLL